MATSSELIVNIDTIELFTWVFIVAFIIFAFFRIYKSIIGSRW